ncbi:MAG TPA: hypothetical protein D7H97_04660, partial [Candidatus Poseidoniales archaeon]
MIESQDGWLVSCLLSANKFGALLYRIFASGERRRIGEMGHFRQFMTLFLTFLLLAPSTILLVDAGGKTTSNLCRGCHGENYGAYVTLSQFSVPAEVGVGEVFDVSVRMILSGNLDQSIASYWRVDTDVTLSSAQNRFSFSPATYTY